MSRVSEAQIMAEAIINAHGGKAFFNFGETSKIIGCGINTIPSLLYESGILVKKVGPSKRISALDIAMLMTQERIAPIDNTSRVARKSI